MESPWWGQSTASDWLIDSSRWLIDWLVQLLEQDWLVDWLIDWLQRYIPRKKHTNPYLQTRSCRPWFLSPVDERGSVHAGTIADGKRMTWPGNCCSPPREYLSIRWEKPPSRGVSFPHTRNRHMSSHWSPVPRNLVHAPCSATAVPSGKWDPSMSPHSRRQGATPNSPLVTRLRCLRTLTSFAAGKLYRVRQPRAALPGLECTLMEIPPVDRLIDWYHVDLSIERTVDWLIDCSSATSTSEILRERPDKTGIPAPTLRHPVILWLAIW